MSSSTDTDQAKKLARAERDWQSMQRICHDFFHGWRRTVQDRYGVEVAKELEMSFYQRIGEGTGKMFLDRGGKPGERGVRNSRSRSRDWRDRRCGQRNGRCSPSRNRCQSCYRIRRRDGRLRIG